MSNLAREFILNRHQVYSLKMPIPILAMRFQELKDTAGKLIAGDY